MRRLQCQRLLPTRKPSVFPSTLYANRERVCWYGEMKKFAMGILGMKSKLGILRGRQALDHPVHAEPHLRLPKLFLPTARDLVGGMLIKDLLCPTSLIRRHCLKRVACSSQSKGFTRHTDARKNIVFLHRVLDCKYAPVQMTALELNSSFQSRRRRQYLVDIHMKRAFPACAPEELLGMKNAKLRSGRAVHLMAGFTQSLLMPLTLTSKAASASPRPRHIWCFGKRSRESLLIGVRGWWRSQTRVWWVVA